jgi:hypothetical protein
MSGHYLKTKAFLIALLAQGALFTGQNIEAKKPYDPNSPLPQDAQIQLIKAGKYIKGGHPERARPIIASLLESAATVPQCVAIADYTEGYGFPLMETRRACLKKALKLCQSQDDLMVVILKSRQYQFFEITRDAINSLIKTANTIPELYKLARAAQHLALMDVAHMAMEKAYTGVGTVNEAIAFAQEANKLGMEDLVRKTLKDLIDDENNSQRLCTLLERIEDLDMKSVNRYLMLKACDKAESISDYEAIAEGARRNHQTDIHERAKYHANKAKLIEKIKSDRAEYEKQMEAWRNGVRDQQLAKQQAEAEKELDSGGSGKDGSNKRFEKDDEQSVKDAAPEGF